MRFTNSLLINSALLSLLLTGCATTSSEREHMPEWVGDRVESDAPISGSKAEDADSPADASTLFGFISKKYLNEGSEKEEKDAPILAIDPNKPAEEQTLTEKEPLEEGTETTLEEPGQKAAPEEVSSDTATEKTTEKKQNTVVAIVQPIAGQPAAAVIDAAPAIPKPKRLIAKNPEHEAQAKAARSEYQVALAEMKSGNLQGALDIFKTLSVQYPLLSGPVVNQGIILRKQGKLKEAKKLLQDALFKKYQNPYLLSELGAINRELGHFKQAKQSYLSAIRIEHAYANAHYNLAVLADLYLHDPELALKEFEIYQSLQEKPNKKVKGWIKELTRRVKRMRKAKS